ncbi:conserved hypothetical protein [Leishmania mexicana MHOM/GT/2001/U1103]|uniref:Uncharacterized protein n=1 Tax=Leishmania mexicana (strain MHOM/GT/2001/U1103) TaxID=929439 RepID=E9ASP2_LEIMU|nr:conserved hypothetical protein [Leishmania mexicana MHOM/GT/2001/U1103]CBZ25965.1 conserved hypothetical protein [Leishmania mexicana MHOM/GT/2001/U1103]
MHMKSSTDRPTTTPLAADTAAYATPQTHGVDSVDGMFGSPLQLDSSTRGTAELHSVLESLSLVTVPNTTSSSQSNLSLAENLLADKDGATTRSSNADHDDATATLWWRYATEDERQNFFASNVTGKDDGSVRGAGNVRVCVKAPVEGQERLLPGGVSPKTTSFSTKCDTSHVTAPAREFSAIWNPQGMLGGTRETLDTRPSVDDASSMVAVVLSEEVPDDLPRAPSTYAELRSSPSTPSVNTIHLNLQYTRVTSFMSISSPFSASVQSISFLRTSVQHLMSNSQHFYASSSSCASANEVPLFGEVGVAEQKPFCASLLETGSVVTQSALEPAKLREGTFAPSSVEARGSSEVVPLIDLSAISAADNASMAQEASPRNPGAPTLPCTPMAYRAVTTSVEGCLLEEEQKRMALVDGQASGIETILAREVSAYLAMSRQRRRAPRQRSEYVGVTEQRKSVEEKASLLHDSMQARMRMAEDEHENFMSSYRQIDQVQLHNAG